MKRLIDASTIKARLHTVVDNFTTTLPPHTTGFSKSSSRFYLQGDDRGRAHPHHRQLTDRA